MDFENAAILALTIGAIIAIIVRCVRGIKEDPKTALMGAALFFGAVVFIAGLVYLFKDYAKIVLYIIFFVAAIYFIGKGK